MPHILHMINEHLIQFN